MADNKQGRLSIHPYIGGTTSNLIANVRKNGGIDKPQVATFVATLCGTLLTSPLRTLEATLYSGKIQKTPIKEAPVFIIGHWRSGTTHLHNVISQDKRFGYLTTLQAVFPTCSVLLSRNKSLKNLVAGLIPEKRMMDNMKMHVDFPQEEEFSVSCITTSSHHCNHFPKTIRSSFDKYVLFNVSDSEKREWKRAYMSVIKKASFMAGGRRLILKNPYNTARIKMLLELFPDAKFIHIYRNPYNIYVSALHDFIKEAEEMALQNFTEQDFAALCYELYGKLMKTYYDSRHLVPKGNLTEVAYEDLEQNPMREVARMYSELGLKLTPEANRDISSYVSSLKDYKKNKYTFSDTLAREITEKWGDFIKRLKYSIPADIGIDEKAAWTCKMDY
ncbi:MAG: sulfotransferase [Kiritimatiellae bacterium]|nr:sulfotransferase [Kiritimatiellia bacterium]